MKKLIDYVLFPIKEFFYSFIILSIVLFIPELFSNNLCLHYILSHIVKSFSFIVIIIYFLVLLFEISKIINKNFFYLLFITVHLLVYIISFSSIFLKIFFGTSINSFVFHLLSETTKEESQGFISIYFTSIKFLLFIISFIILLFLIKYFIKFILKKYRYLINYTSKSFIVLYLFFSLGLFFIYLPNFSSDYIANAQKIKTYHPMSSNVIFQISQAIWQYKEDKEVFSILGESNDNVHIDSCSYKSSNIIVIIGESFNKYHSSLYNYSLNTNPKLSSDTSLYIYNDVIAPYNVTFFCFRNFMSMASVDDDLEWNRVPLVLSLFKSAGYNVVFYSNQFVKQLEQDVFDASASFLYHPLIESKIISHGNTIHHEYDGNLIEKYKSERHEMENDSNNLIIFHLIGQHIPASWRYPESENYFTADSINRESLNEEQKKQVAQFDNATRYNDKVVSDIIEMYEDKDAIVIYFSDHGDEINDFRPKVGRSYDFMSAGVPCFHCQLDIPFMIHLSSLYKINHPEIVKSIERSLNYPFMTDDLPHLLLDLAGISSSYYQPERDLLSEQYNISRKRLVGWGQEYDYDKICKDNKFEFTK